jgi:hypothetical protein
METYNLVQFFEDGQYEYVRRNVSAEEAVHASKHYTNSVAAKLGFVTRVIITDSGDSCVFEWKYGVGVTFPTREDIKESRKDEGERSAALENAKGLGNLQ